ncbi:hypothetical protein AXF42_Ash006041 [Apostasia shenzhenica]|uniref:Uncharacterized protein n=1 Tax=Apostasia shenzhenica TaxID=1088818 RepID=A0A2I0B042_9ASPA|nr:hypothetical protein AXF42_Ash006041 [Apostasia shenzhenica]
MVKAYHFGGSLPHFFAEFLFCHMHYRSAIFLHLFTILQWRFAPSPLTTVPSPSIFRSQALRPPPLLSLARPSAETDTARVSPKSPASYISHPSCAWIQLLTETRAHLILIWNLLIQLLEIFLL